MFQEKYHLKLTYFSLKSNSVTPIFSSELQLWVVTVKLFLSSNRNLYQDKISQHGFITFCSDEWNSIYPRSGERRLLGSWTFLFSKKLREIFPECPITFKRNIVHTENSHKNAGVHLRVTAICKFQGDIIKTLY